MQGSLTQMEQILFPHNKMQIRTILIPQKFTTETSNENSIILIFLINMQNY